MGLENLWMPRNYSGLFKKKKSHKELWKDVMTVLDG